MSEPATIFLVGVALVSTGAVFSLAGTLTRRADAIRGDLAEIMTAVWHRTGAGPDREIGAVVERLSVAAADLEQAIDRLRASAKRAGQESAR